MVVKVNSENTIAKQRLPDLHCRKWVLDPQENQVLIPGYQVDEKTVEKFRALPVAESKAQEIRYGTDVGTITVTVFGEQKALPAGYDTDGAKNDAAVASTQTPAEEPANADALINNLQEMGNRSIASRDLLVEGEREGPQVQVWSLNRTQRR